ncbi:MAG: tRNA threonylcarbamoyladenosine biosynthesis protein TsaB [Paracoccaceae bacterium]|jgi:tRNA threonylcarbamoyladenosine biosynthesis protein TsaB
MTESGKILAIDTSSALCTVALLLEGRVRVRQTQTAKQAALSLLPMVEELLSEAALPLSALDGIAIASGPGSFTGLRIGIGAVQGLSMAAQIPVIALSNLAVACFGAIKRSTCNAAIACFYARDGEVYFGAYAANTELGVVLIGTEQVAPITKLDFDQSLGATLKHWTGVGDAWSESVTLEKRLGLNVIKGTLGNELHIEDLCGLANLRWRAGDVLDPQHVQPNYIKEQLDY